ncbi:MAG TPA: SDR family oxidoreductase [Burkholderiaceae bacterium]|nr:SDR family oxidoreductase [Burkholderiaceae bacterium]
MRRTIAAATRNMQAKFDFSGRVALIVGGTTGIGAATAQAFRSAGARVIATGVSEAELGEALANAAFADIELVRLDVLDTAAIPALIEPLPRLDVVVYCAGIIRRDAEFDPTVFEQVLAVNVSGGMRVATAARPLLARSGGGSILFIASMLSYFGGPKSPAYSASKGAVRQLTMSLAGAYAADQIRVNAVAPGWIVTNLSRGARDDESRNAMIVARTPMARWGQPDEVADPIMFLCSDAARFITGAIVPVDGGFLTI